MANNNYTKEDLLALMKDVKNTFTDINAAIVDRGGDNSVDGWGLPYAVSTIPKGVLDYHTANISENGKYYYKATDYGVDGFYGVEINVNVSGGEGGYSYFDGSFDEQGLRDLGWTDDDIKYFKSYAPHYAWEDSMYVVSDGNKEYNYKNYEYQTFLVGAMANDTVNASFYPYIPEHLVYINSSDDSWGTYCFQNLRNTIGIPAYDTSLRTSFYRFFANCEKLKFVPLINTKNGTNFYGMFDRCRTITSIPPIDTSKGTSFSNMFNSCASLQSIPLLDTSNGTDFSGMFYGCSNLTTIPPLDTSNGTDLNGMFSNCSRLQRIEGIDFSNATGTITPFGTTLAAATTALTKMIVIGSINTSINFGRISPPDFESMVSILTAANNTKNSDAKTMTWYNKTVVDQDGQLAALKADCESKGWQITGLTLS